MSVDSRSISTSPRLPLTVWVLAAGTFLMATTELIVAGLLREIARDLRVTVAQTGLLVSVFALGMTIGAPIVALLTLRLPRRTILLLVLTLFTAAHVVIAFSDSFAVIMVCRFLTAVATGAFWSVAAVVATRLADPSISSRALTVAFAGGTLANVLGGPLGSFVGQVIGWRGVFLSVAVLAVGIGILVHRMVPPDRPEHQAAGTRRELAALRSGRLWLVLPVSAGVNGGVLSIFSYVAPLMTERTGLSESLVPVGLAVFGVGTVIGTLFTARFGDRAPFRIIATGTITTFGLMVVLIPLSLMPAPILAVLFLLGVFGFLGNPILVNLTIRYAGAAPNLATAIATSAFNLGTAIGTAIAAAALSGVGPTGPILVGSAITGLLFVPLFWLITLQRRTARTTHHSRSAVHGPRSETSPAVPCRD